MPWPTWGRPWAMASVLVAGLDLVLSLWSKGFPAMWERWCCSAIRCFPSRVKIAQLIGSEQKRRYCGKGWLWHFWPSSQRMLCRSLGGWLLWSHLWQNHQLPGPCPADASSCHPPLPDRPFILIHTRSQQADAPVCFWWWRWWGPVTQELGGAGEGPPGGPAAPSRASGSLLWRPGPAGTGTAAAGCPGDAALVLLGGFTLETRPHVLSVPTFGSRSALLKRAKRLLGVLGLCRGMIWPKRWFLPSEVLLKIRDADSRAGHRLQQLLASGDPQVPEIAAPVPFAGGVSALARFCSAQRLFSQRIALTEMCAGRRWPCELS